MISERLRTVFATIPEAVETANRIAKDPREEAGVTPDLVAIVKEADGDITGILGALQTFISSRYKGAVLFDPWLSYVERALPSSIANQDIEIITDSFDVMDNGIPLEEYLRFMPIICRYFLLRKSKQLKEIIDSDVDDETKTRFIRYCSLLKDISTEPLPYDDEGWLRPLSEFMCRKFKIKVYLPKLKAHISPPNCSDDWLEKTAEDFDMPKQAFIHWMDTVLREWDRLHAAIDAGFDIAEKHNNELHWELVHTLNEMVDFNKYRDAIGDMFELGVNVMGAYKLRQHLSFEEHVALAARRPIINADKPIETKILYLKYYDILNHIPNPRYPFSLQIVGCDESWLRQIAQDLGMGYGRFKQWLDDVVSEEGASKYVSILGTMVRNNIDLVRAFELRKHLRFRGRRLVAIKNIINADEPLERKALFLQGIKGEEHLLAAHAPETLDAEEWLNQANTHAENYFRSRGIGLVYPTRYLCAVLSSVRNSEEDLLNLARAEADGKSLKRLFRLGKSYSTERVFSLKEKLDPVGATRLLINGLISRAEARQAMALKYFMPEKLSIARAYIEGSNTPPVRFYISMKEQIKALGNDLPYPELRQAGRALIEAISSLYLTGTSDCAGKTELRELVWLVNSLYNDDEIFDTITAKMQDGAIWDLGNGERLLCCAMVSEDRERTEAEALYYCLDPYIGLMHIVPSLNGEYGQPIGAAILANCQANGEVVNGKSVLLVDSMEGGTLFQRIRRKASFGLATQGILGAAYDCNAEYIFFNTKTGGDTPRRYNHYIRKLIRAKPVEIELAKLPDDSGLTARKERYLEAFEDQEKLSGAVQGYLVGRNELRDKLAEAVSR